MSWARFLPAALAGISAMLVFVGLAQTLVFEQHWTNCEPDLVFERPLAAALLCLTGTAGLAFVAWLRR